MTIPELKEILGTSLLNISQKQSGKNWYQNRACSAMCWWKTIWENTQLPQMRWGKTQIQQVNWQIQLSRVHGRYWLHQLRSQVWLRGNQETWMEWLKRALNDPWLCHFLLIKFKDNFYYFLKCSKTLKRILKLWKIFWNCKKSSIDECSKEKNNCQKRKVTADAIVKNFAKNGAYFDCLKQKIIPRNMKTYWKGIRKFERWKDSQNRTSFDEETVNDKVWGERNQDINI